MVAGVQANPSAAGRALAAEARLGCVAWLAQLGAATPHPAVASPPPGVLTRPEFGLESCDDYWANISLCLGGGEGYVNLL